MYSETSGNFLFALFLPYVFLNLTNFYSLKLASTSIESMSKLWKGAKVIDMYFRK